MEMKEKKLGFIGLGVMGKPMAKNLLKAGYKITVHNRSRTSVEELSKLGAPTASTPAEVAEESDVILTCLPSPVEVKEVFLGSRGLVEKAGPGKTVIDTSTIDPLTAKAMAEELKKKGSDFMDAPISGGPARAEDGTLTFMVGGDTDVFERCAEVLKTMGKNVFHVGPVGAGQSVKLVNQILCAVNFVTVSEAVLWGAKAGIKPETLYEVIKTSAGTSFIFEHAMPSIAKNEFGSGFQTWLYCKDLGLVLEMASKFNVSMIFTPLAEQILTRSKALGFERKDAASVVKAMEKIMGAEAN